MASGAHRQTSPDPWAVRRLRLHFVGEVQGVGFRWTARRVANNLGLSGWVRNEFDGSVSMELQGLSRNLAQYFTMFDRSYANYPLSYVIDEKEDIEPLPDDTVFEVRF